MAVRVKHAQLDNSGYYEKVHAQADDFSVQDGHLIVTGWKDGHDANVAVYAPSKWLAAFVEDDDAE